MIDCCPQCRVLASLDRDPPVRVLGHLAEVRCDDDELGTLVACLGDEVHVGCPRHVEVRAHRDDELAVVPVGALTDVRLVSPDLGERVREIGVPVIETEVEATE
ncbi:hypothetical protein HRbin27_02014 [bacterium HR27]|nr:hypothetical protein HRbin27_02014 [bacterium HR27]